MCPCSSQGLEKDLPQKGHLQPAVWVLMCMLRAAGLLYSLLQTPHVLAGPESPLTGLAWTVRSRGSLCSAGQLLVGGEGEDL